MAKAAKQQETNVVKKISISTTKSPNLSNSSSSSILSSETERNISQNLISPSLKQHLRDWQNKRQGISSSFSSTIQNIQTTETFSTNERKQFGRNDSTFETDDDIATIAKQISDHAEIIYQNWKSRGLAPSEIFDDQASKNSLHFLQNNLEYPISELLINSPDMSNNNLNKLVNSFINEDKARQLTSGKKADFSTVNISCTNSGFNENTTDGSNNKISSLNITSGTIRDTLRKFESINSTSSNIKPNFLNTKSISSLNSNNLTTSNDSHKSSSFQKTLQSNKVVPNVLPESTLSLSNNKTTPKSTISDDTTICSGSTKSTSLQLISNGISGLQLNKPQTPVKPANLLKHRNQNQALNEGVLSVSSSLLNVNKQKTAILPLLSKQQSPSQTSTNQGKVDEGISNISKISDTTTSISSTVLGSKQISTQQEKQTEPKHNKKKSIVSNKQHNNYILPSSPTSSETNFINKEEQTNNTVSHKSKSDLLVEVIREEEHLINSLKSDIPLNKNDKIFKIDKKNGDLKQKHVAHPQINSNIKNENIVQSFIANEQNKNNLTEGKNERISLKINSGKKKSLVENISIAESVSPQKESLANTGTSQVLIAPSKKLEQCEIDISSPKKTSTSNTSNKSDIISKYSTTSSNSSTQLAPKSFNTRSKMRSKNDAVVPHGANQVDISKPNINPVKPFFTRGSVAERIMMFEKCPDVMISPFRHVNRETHFKPKLHAVHSVVPKSEPQSHTTLQRAVRSSNAKTVYIPRFHYPHGKPLPNIAQETIIQQVKAAFDAFPNNQCPKQDFDRILKLCNLPFYWRMPFIACTQIMAGPLIDGYRFVDFWKQMSIYCHDLESKFVYILSRGQKARPYILPEDLTPLVQDVVDTHPGLAFLKEASEFHSRYIHTVISRIFYSVNRSWSNRITISELRRSNLLQVIQLLEEEEDINQIMAYFSYEHFYVIYCKFWELDRDHDLFIDHNDLAQHNNHALSTRIIERIFSGCVTRGEKNHVIGPKEPKMCYTDFVWFLLSEEDKTNPTSIEYWFRCMDLDGDGVISMYELEYFYEEQQERMFSLGIETLPFEDCLCQMLDMIKPKTPGCISLGDLKRCKMTSVFFDTFFNLVKYLEYEQRDPFASQKDGDDMTDWDRYAAQEYELLVAEENDAQGSYDDEDDDSESAFDIIDINTRQRIPSRRTNNSS